ncbi:MAG: hypothetical protein II377_03935, partial [Clostridia bacterium]|nr:hypothetical protein [Clostridia bacterium]
MRKYSSILAFVLVAVMLFALVGCNPTGETSNTSTDASGDESNTEIVVETFEGDFTWKDSVSTLATNWNPHTYETSDDSYPLDFIVSGLYTFVFNDELNPVEGKDPYSGYVIVPEMAAAMPVDVTEDIKASHPQFNIPEDATSGYAYVIDLNPNAKWQDGTPINADTYVYSMEKLFNSELINYRATDYMDGDLAIAGGRNYYNSGRTIWEANSADGAAMNFKFADLVKGEDGAYTTADGVAVYFGLNYGYAWMGGNTLTYYKGHFPEGVYDSLAALADEEGYVAITDESIELLYSFTSTDGWGNESKDDLGYYVSYQKTYEKFDFANVGIIKTGDYQITLVLEKSLSGFYLLYNLSGNWLVYEDLYESCLKKEGNAYISTYNTS